MSISVVVAYYFVFLGILLSSTPEGTNGQHHVVGLVPDELSIHSDNISLEDLAYFATPSDEVERSDDVKYWPFRHKNSSDANGGDNNTNSSSATSNACATTETCEVCNSYHTCHWCAHDSSCHAIGSVHGCLVGSTCESKKKKKPARNETDPTGCLAHEGCSECALASHLCHWCAHDNACHAVGSIYGCLTGVDCYDNSRCQRTKPEPFAERNLIPPVGALPLFVIGTISAIILCCATTCCCIVGGLKGAYDDLADLAEAQLRDTNDAAASTSSRAVALPPTAAESRRERRRTKARAADGRQAVAAAAAANEEVPTAVAPLKTDQLASTEVLVAAAAAANDKDGASKAPDEFETLLEQGDDAASDDYVRMVDGEEAELMSPLRPQQQHRRRRPRRSIHRLYTACMCCYVFTVALVGFSAFSVVRFFPKKPVYNICNDSVAWKSIIDSMTAMKATADFELLASIYNPNHFDVALDMGKGSFSHDGAFVGTYEIPPVMVAATAITDILIVATFTPEKWEAISIGAEYYRGTLVLHVDVEMSIRVPALADYAFTASVKDKVVHVNELSDRHLCACPTWSSTNKTTPLLPPVPHWVDAK